MEDSRIPIKAGQLKGIFKERGFSLKQKWGQNFLINQDICQGIAKALPNNGTDLIIEIGPGLGSLSVFLAEHAGHLALVEIDPSLTNWLGELFYKAPNVSIHNLDALKFDFQDFAREKGHGEYLIIGNLPYYITTPLLKHFLEHQGWKAMVLMIQKEAALRLTAQAGSKDYSLLNLKLQYLAEIELLEEVPPEAFYPSPEVDSVVIRLLPKRTKPVFVKDEDLFFKVVGASFEKRRKTVLNSLCGSSLLTKEGWKRALAEAGIAENRRGESLTLEEFAALANAVTEE